MKKYKEIIIEFGYKRTDESIIEEIEKEAEKLYRDGWFYENSYIDGTLGNIYLFFYKSID